MIEKIISEIKIQLKNHTPNLTDDQKTRMYRILNSENRHIEMYGLKTKEIEDIVKLIYNKYENSYDNAINVFKDLISSNIVEEKFAGLWYLHQFKKYFNQETIELFYTQYHQYCDSWALCDSSCIRVLGPFLNRKGNGDLAKNTIEKWSKSKNIWIRRASLVILLKLIMLKKDFFISQTYVFNLIEKMLQYNEDYIQKAIGWLLKTCSKYKSEIIFDYLIKNKEQLPRLILRYASEKLPENKRTQILKK